MCVKIINKFINVKNKNLIFYNFLIFVRLIIVIFLLEYVFLLYKIFIICCYIIYSNMYCDLFIYYILNYVFVFCDR